MILEFFLLFVTFPNKWVGRAMGNEALNLDGSLTGCIKSENSSDMRMAEHVMW